MSQFKRLFVMLGPQMRYSPALQRAAALAESSGALLDINIFVDDVDTFGLMSDSRERERLLDDNRQWLADAAEQLRDSGLDVSTELLLTRDPLSSVIEQIERLGCDLLVKDVQHEPVLKRLLVTPSIGNCSRTARWPCTWSAISACPCPARSPPRSTSTAMVRASTWTNR